MIDSIKGIAGFCKKKGFVYPSSEIYSDISAIYDYGHYGVELKNNIASLWWNDVVRKRTNIYGLDSAIFHSPKTWVASGHVDSFDDPQIDCKNCKSRIRADHLLEKKGIDVDKMSASEINEIIDGLDEGLQCPVCGAKELTEARQFNLMVKSNIGSPTDELTEENVVYLRPETCQGIFLNYLNVRNSVRAKVPFGIAQIGKAFRNEIVARQFIFRTREFEQMEMQFFVHPDGTKEAFDYWKEERLKWYDQLGIAKENLRWHQHSKLAHYASEAFDIEYNFKCVNGFKEVEGVHMRGDWDLSQHSKHSGAKLEYHDTVTNTKFIPHVVETSVGLNRLFLMVIDACYTEEQLEKGQRVVLKFPNHLAPVKCAVFPLVKNKPELVEKARGIYETLAQSMTVEWDDNSNVGKRYRRQDEIGTPYCITVDYESLEDNTVTIRDRDTMKQIRIDADQVKRYLEENL